MRAERGKCCIHDETCRMNAMTETAMTRQPSTTSREKGLEVLEVPHPQAKF